MSDTVYILVNEFQPIGSDNSSTEFIFASLDYQEALDEIVEIAQELNAYIGNEPEFEVDLEDDSHLEFDSYYIIEKELGRRE